MYFRSILFTFRQPVLLVLASSMFCWVVDDPIYAAVDVWLTKGDKTQLLSQQPTLEFQTGTGSGGFTITVTPGTTYQSIDGFGAALTDSSAWLIQNKLNQSQRDDLMNLLFSPETGIGTSYLRIPMGASDFTASGQYTYNDLPTNQIDIPQNNFSIAHDQQYIIPQLQQALSINPGLKIMASPWSAPAWMKTNKSLIGGSLATQYEASYATYFQKFIEAYEAEGVPIESVSLQNEPHHTPGNYPGMYMSSSQQADLIKNHVGPTFAENNIDTKIFLWDHNWDEPDYPIAILNDPQAKQYVAGSAFHGYAGNVNAQSTVHDAHPDKEIHFTEIAGGDFAPTFSDNLVFGIENIIIGNTRNWGQSAIYWNLALDENHGPHLGGCTDCRGVVTINSGTGNVTLNEEYYTIAHASKFVQPGAVRIDSRTINDVVETVAFRNPDGSRALIALNPGNSSRSFRIVEEGEHFSYTLTAKSVATFVWSANDEPPDPDAELLFNPGFSSEGSGWSKTGNTDFNSYFGPDAHASFYTDNSSHSGSIYQTGIAAQPGEEFKLVLADTRIEENANADFQFGLEFWGAGKVGETFVQLPMSGTLVAHGEYSMTGTAPAGTQFVRPVFKFDNVVSVTGVQENIFIFEASLKRVAVETGDFDGDGDVDGNDFLMWQRGETSPPLSAAALAAWKANYGTTLPLSAASQVVPEPPSLGLGLMWAIGLGAFSPLRAH